MTYLCLGVVCVVLVIGLVVNGSLIVAIFLRENEADEILEKQRSLE